MTASAASLSAPPARGLERLGWAMFDWAQQPYLTLVAAFIFKPYFAAGFVGDPVRGQVLIGYAGGVAALAVAVLSPLVGARLDATGRGKLWTVGLSAPFVLACVGLWWAAPGELSRLPMVLTCLVVAAVSAELTVAVNNAMLPGVARPGAVGRLSGSGVALGYAGGLVAVVLYLFAFTFADQPWLGLDPTRREPDRIVGPYVALWYVVFLIPLLLWTRDRPRATGPVLTWRFLRDALATRSPGRQFLIGRTLVADGLAAGAVFGGVLAAGLFGWEAAELGAYGLGLLILAGIGAWGSGKLDGRVSAKRLVLASVFLLAIAIIGVAGVSANRIFGLPLSPPGPDDGFLVSTPERVFMALGWLIGLATGPLQSSMRAWMAELTPRGAEGRWFGLFAFSNKATAFAAPILIAALTQATGRQWIAMPVVVAFLAAGWLTLRGVPSVWKD